jgi:hypothetical protein
VRFKKDIDFVVYYAEKLKEDNKFFQQQKVFLESQIKASKSIFSAWQGRDFKKRARKYLAGRGII